VCFLWASPLSFRSLQSLCVYPSPLSALHLLLLSSRLFPLSYSLPPISSPVPRTPTPPPPVLPSHSIHLSGEISHLRGNLKSGSSAKGNAPRPSPPSPSERKRNAIFFSGSREKEQGDVFRPFCNDFLCRSIERGISQRRGRAKLLHSLRTRVNKTSSR